MPDKKEIIYLEARCYEFKGSGQYIARILGRDSKFVFNREFIGSKLGKRMESTEADTDTVGLYEIRDITSKGNKDDKYRLILELPDGGGLVCLKAGSDNLDTDNDKAVAMDIAKRMDTGERFEGMIALECVDGTWKYRVRSKRQTEKASQAQTRDSAIAACWAVLEPLPTKEAKSVLQELKKKLTPAAERPASELLADFLPEGP